MRLSAVSTECSVRKRAAATCLFELPLGDELGDAALGLGERVSRRGPAADAAELGAGLVGPEGRTEGLEARERVLEGGPGGAALLRPSLRPAEREQRAGA